MYHAAQGERWQALVARLIDDEFLSEDARRNCMCNLSLVHTYMLDSLCAEIKAGTSNLSVDDYTSRVAAWKEFLRLMSGISVS